MPIRLNLSYKDGAFSFYASALRLKFNIPLVKKTEKKKIKSRKTGNKKTKKSDEFSRLENFFAVLQSFYETSEKIRKSVVVEKLEVNAEYGSEDAAFTGFAIGIAYAEIYKLIGFLGTIFTFEQPVITIKPNFEDKAVFTLSFEGIIKTKAAHIISAAYKFYSEYKKAIK